ncbi:glycoside hydrolase family 88 protein [Haloferax marisrubri]|uniref:Glycosyl hydrolase family 88 n=1 Tax=Haloferax marisrubri TaxID=1544719 RepID=A0A2P4NMB4_9EURY|nr:glycoside hydrolase family 88 protein [Haloferax marisrubri]POG54289.1 hypothetical protein AUR65_016760 [Haloferax marisrubri]
MGTLPSQQRLANGLDAIVHRIGTTLNDVEPEFPYFADPETGEWETTPDGDWCGGHWIGLLRLAADVTDNDAQADRFNSAADEYTDTLVGELPETTMFRGMNLLYAGFRGYDTTGRRDLFGLGLAGADAMVANYNEQARQIPLGDFQIRGPDNFRGAETEDEPSGLYIGAVDNVYTALPVLWRAFEETGDPVFRDVAISHADRHLDWYIKDDGSTWHHAMFDESDGSLGRQYNELAASDQTCWGRGQGWNIAGLARAYTETGAERYLNALVATTNYYTEHAPEDLVATWDIELDAETEPRDTSAAALAAYGLCRLPDVPECENLRGTGAEILDSLLESYLVTDEDDERRGMVRHGCFNKPGEYVTDNGLVWTDYYVAYTLWSLLSDR